MTTPYNVSGEYLNCWPYVRGHYARDMLYQIWRAIEDAHDWDKILWDTKLDDSPIPMQGDLTQWIQFIHSEVDPKVLLVMQDKTALELAGIVWFNRVRDNEAWGCIWMAPKFRGKPSREAVHLGLEHAFYAMHWTKVWAMTPWAKAANLVKKCGFKQVTTIPRVYRVNGEPADIHILAVEEHDYGR